jgi:hypothetical protein
VSRIVDKRGLRRDASEEERERGQRVVTKHQRRREARTDLEKIQAILVQPWYDLGEVLGVPLREGGFVVGERLDSRPDVVVGGSKEPATSRRGQEEWISVLHASLGGADFAMKAERAGETRNAPEDPEDLVDLRVSWEEGLPHDHLGEDTPHGPHVERCRVVSGSEQDLGSSVPQGDDLRTGHRSALALGQTSRRTKRRLTS